MRIPITIGGLVVALLAAPSVKADGLHGHYYQKQYGFMFFKNRLPAGQGWSNSGPPAGPRVNSGPPAGSYYGCYGGSGPPAGGPPAGGPPAGCNGSSGPPPSGPPNSNCFSSGPPGDGMSGPLASLGTNALLDLLCRGRAGGGGGGIGGLGGSAPDLGPVNAKLDRIETALKSQGDKVAGLQEELVNKIKALETKLDGKLTAVSTDVAALKTSVQALDAKLKAIEAKIGPVVVPPPPPPPGGGAAAGPPVIIPSAAEVPVLPTARRE